MIDQYVKPNIEKLQSTVKHIVVLMLENRSFDNLLGWLYEGKQPPGGQHFEGLTYGLWNPLDNIDTDGLPFKEKVYVEKNGQEKKFHGKPVDNPVDFTLPSPDPGEGYKDTNHQLFQVYNVPLQYPPPPTNMGFVQNYQNAMIYGTYSFGDAPTDPRAIMKCYTPEQTPVLSKLATSFAVCDRYFCSVPSQTLPNRDFVHAATSTGFVNNGPESQCDAKTIYNQIQDAIDDGRTDLSWGIFGNNIFSNKPKDREGKFGKDHFSLTRVIMKQLHDSKYENNFGTLDQFKELCDQGDLPSYSFLEPNYGGEGQNDQHPPSDIRPGEQLIADIYNAIRDSPCYEETLFIITYDEHGGCYDHYPPPGGAKNPYLDKKPGQDGFLFNRFGVRVPCVLVSPYIQPGLIARASGYIPFDHSSIIKTVQNCFQLKGHLTERDRAAPDFSGVLTLDSPITDKVEVEPLDWDRDAPAPAINELHRLIGTVVSELTGSVADEAEHLLEFIQKSYNNHFGTGKKA